MTLRDLHMCVSTDTRTVKCGKRALKKLVAVQLRNGEWY